MYGTMVIAVFCQEWEGSTTTAWSGRMCLGIWSPLLQVTGSELGEDGGGGGAELTVPG